MKWTDQDIQRVRDISIADTLGVPVGKRTKIPCPMPDHHDKTPSFLIDENNGYHCFGCGAHGHGFIDFLQDMGYEFKDIMNEYGIKKENNGNIDN